MAKAKNSAPSDAERRRMLNEERTPRKNFVYEMEATCEVNPITGRSYWAEGDSDYVKDSLLGGVSYSDKCNNLINIYVPATPSEFIEYQFALARMDVRDGKEGKEGKLSQGEYDVQLRNVSAVTKRFREAGISLDCITSPEALKDTMNNVALSERMRELMPLEEVLSNKGYSPDFPDAWWKTGEKKPFYLSFPPIKPIDTTKEKYNPKPLQRDSKFDWVPTGGAPPYGSVYPYYS